METPIDLAAALSLLGPEEVAVVDCLTLWVSNLMLRDLDVDTAGEALAGVLANCAATVVVVSNEVGLGVVPENALARRFRDAAGRLNQTVAEAADAVLLIVAGQVLPLKPQPGGDNACA